MTVVNGGGQGGPPGMGARGYAMFRLHQALNQGSLGHGPGAIMAYQTAMKDPEKWWRAYSAQAFAPPTQGQANQPGMDPAIHAAMSARAGAAGAPGAGTHPGFDPAAVQQKLQAMQMIRQKLMESLQGDGGMGYPGAQY